MEDFALHIVQNPVLYIGYLFAALGAVGVLLFFSGFFGGIKHLFTYSESADHMEHARTRAMWGLYICMVALGLWETLRLILGEVPASTWILIVILLSPLWAPYLKSLLTGKSGGH
jgi:hypothetical protein